MTRKKARHGLPQFRSTQLIRQLSPKLGILDLQGYYLLGPLSTLHKLQHLSYRPSKLSFFTILHDISAHETGYATHYMSCSHQTLIDILRHGSAQHLSSHQPIRSGYHGALCHFTA